jgi:hypothetical protein
MVLPFFKRRNCSDLRKSIPHPISTYTRMFVTIEHMEGNELERELFSHEEDRFEKQVGEHVSEEQETASVDHTILEWEAPEFVYYPKDRFWYTIASLVTLLGALNAYLMQNVLFATLILLGGTIIVFTASKKPGMTPYQIDWRGITINGTNHRFFEYESFWIEEKRTGNVLLLSPSKTLAQQTVVPLGNMDLYTVQKYLLNHLPEVPDHEPLSHKIMEYLGF